VQISHLLQAERATMVNAVIDRTKIDFLMLLVFGCLIGFALIDRSGLSDSAALDDAEDDSYDGDDEQDVDEPTCLKTEVADSPADDEDDCDDIEYVSHGVCVGLLTAQSTEGPHPQALHFSTRELHDSQHLRGGSA